MKLSALFRKKTSSQLSTSLIPDARGFLVNKLQKKLEALGYEVKKSDVNLTLTLNTELEITCSIIESPDYSPLIMHVSIITAHQRYFSFGIAENVVGAGNNIDEKTEAVLKNYLVTTFPPIMEGFSETHRAEYDYFDENKVLWHPKLGDLSFQGKWEKHDDGTAIFDRIRRKLPAVMEDKKFNWIKFYAARQPDGNIMAECLLNNVLWKDGIDELINYAKTWGHEGVFLGLKQFIMIRRCDKYDFHQ